MDQKGQRNQMSRQPWLLGWSKEPLPSCRYARGRPLMDNGVLGKGAGVKRDSPCAWTQASQTSNG